jgi:hypothetical protein
VLTKVLLEVRQLPPARVERAVRLRNGTQLHVRVGQRSVRLLPTR